MKNFILLVLSLFFIVNTASANDYEEIYVVGSAVAMTWRTPGDYKMQKNENGLFTWKGFIADNTANRLDNGKPRGFKFTVSQSWEPSLICNPEGEGHLIVEEGENQLYLRKDGDPDYQLQVASSGIYEITIDPNTLIMTCIREKEVEDIYLVGDGTLKGWYSSINNDFKMKREDNGIYTWTGNFIGNPQGDERFKFLFGDSWDHSLTCNIRTGEEVIHLTIESGEVYDLYPRQTQNDGRDNAFKVPYTGIYTVTLDLSAMTIVCVEETPDLNNLYLIGSATEARWDNGKAIPMTCLSEGIFVWTGYLDDIDPEGKQGEFKFLSDKAYWDTGFNALEENTEAIAGVSYDLNYRVNAKISADNKFIVTTPGQYAITVDLNERTMFIESAEITRLVEEDAYGTICLPMDATVENATIYEVAGIDLKDDKPSTLYLKETDNNEMLAGVPYIFQATEAGTVKFSYTGTDYAFEPQTANGLVGTYERLQVPMNTDNYILSVGYKWYLVDSEFYSGANRAYLDLTATSVYNGESNNARAMNFDGNDGATGIADSEAENPIVDVYTIQGIKVRSQVKADEAKDGLLKGIYIINGKKEIVM